MPRKKVEQIPSKTVKEYTFEERSSACEGRLINDCLVLRVTPSSFVTMMQHVAIAQMAQPVAMIDLRIYGKMVE